MVTKHPLKRFRPGQPRHGKCFPTGTAFPLPIETKRQIYREYRCGDSVEEVGKAVLPESSIVSTTASREMCAARIMELPLDLHGQRAVRPPAVKEEGARDTGPAAQETDLATEESRLPSGIVCVRDQPLRSAVADARAGGAPLSEDPTTSSSRRAGLTTRWDLDRPRRRLMDRDREFARGVGRDQKSESFRRT